ncbi:hypothetical protein K4H28_13715 [Deefgea tanakiae]|uniref:Uncharacterized protein n=1 Tax=Deefgea tanakiae TaxID=2865840 RepID=A0ABX8Z421_9NEIS|nr:hypothetical protein [Deefgea tanakiae]QZA77328.1 hypothetical protein K4H28_13715 [Deefgea tanakiae]
MNQVILEFINQHLAEGQTLNQAISAAELKFSLSATLVCLSIVLAQSQQAGLAVI